MRKIISLILCLISLPAAAQIIPPRYAGSDDPDVFRKQFEKKVTKVMKRDGYRIEELSHELLMKFYDRHAGMLRRCTISRFAGRSAIQSDPAQPGAVEYGIIGIEPFHPGIQGRPKNPVCAKNADQYEFPAGSFRQADIPG